MDRSIVLSTLAVGCAGWLCGLLLVRSRRETAAARMSLTLPVAALVLLVAVAAATLPAVGLVAAPALQAWGRGFAAGGIAALLAGLAARRSIDPADRLRAPAGAAAISSAAVAAVAAAVLWMASAILDALAGIGAGWVVVSLVLYAGTRPGSMRGARASSDSSFWTVALGVGFVTTLSATVALGHFREAAGAQTTPWVASALVTGALVPVVLLIAGAVGRVAGGRGTARSVSLVVLACVLMAVVAAMVGTRTLHEPRFLAAAGIGLLLPLILTWLIAEGERSSAAPVTGDLPLHGALAALVALGSGIAAFYALAGYGVGIMLTAGWLPLGLLIGWGLIAPAPRSGDRLMQLFLFGVLLLLYRLFVQRFQEDIGAAALTDHFAILSILVGAIMPSLLAGLLRGSSPEGSESAAVGLVRLALALTGAVAFGATLLVLWGAKAGLGLLGGLMLGVVISGGGSPGALLALAMALPLMQWSHALLTIASQTRAEKVRVLIWLVTVSGAVIVAADVWRRIARPAARGVQEGAEL